MDRIIKSMEEKYLISSLDLVETVFTAHSDAEEGKLVRSLVEEIRSKRFYLPNLELIMVDENDEVIGYVNFARFHLEGRYENELLLPAGDSHMESVIAGAAFGLAVPFLKGRLKGTVPLLSGKVQYAGGAAKYGGL